MKSIKSMLLGELAAFVNTHLDSKGIPFVLSGRTCVSLFAHNRCLSYDLDEIRRWSKVEDQLDKFEEIKENLGVFSN